MKRAWPWLAVGLAGLVIGVLSVRLLEAVTTDASLERQRQALVRQEADLKAREAVLASGQTQLAGQAAELRSKLSAAANQADTVLASQGTAVERLKRVLEAVRQLRDEIETLGVPPVRQ